MLFPAPELFPRNAFRKELSLAPLLSSGFRREKNDRVTSRPLTNGIEECRKVIAELVAEDNSSLAALSNQTNLRDTIYMSQTLSVVVGGLRVGF